MISNLDREQVLNQLKRDWGEQGAQKLISKITEILSPHTPQAEQYLTLLLEPSFVCHLNEFEQFCRVLEDFPSTPQALRTAFIASFKEPMTLVRVMALTEQQSDQVRAIGLLSGEQRKLSLGKRFQDGFVRHLSAHLNGQTNSAIISFATEVEIALAAVRTWLKIEVSTNPSKQVYAVTSELNPYYVFSFRQLISAIKEYTHFSVDVWESGLFGPEKYLEYQKNDGEFATLHSYDTEYYVENYAPISEIHLIENWKLAAGVLPTQGIPSPKNL